MIQEPYFAEIFQQNPQFATIKKLYDQDRWLFETFVETLIEYSKIAEEEYRDGYDNGYSHGHEEGYDAAVREYEEGQ